MSDFVSDDSSWLDDLHDYGYELEAERGAEIEYRVSSDGRLVIIISSVTAPLIVCGMIFW